MDNKFWKGFGIGALCTAAAVAAYELGSRALFMKRFGSYLEERDMFGGDDDYDDYDFGHDFEDEGDENG